MQTLTEVGRGWPAGVVLALLAGRTPARHLALRDGGLRGGMMLLPSTTAVRIIELKRVQGSE